MTTRRVLARPGSRFAGRAGAVALTTALLVAVVVGWAAPASASSYRYWSYWHGTSGGGWTFSQVGAQYQPAAGSVDGWRFAVSGTAGSVKPRAAASFDAICGSHAPAPAGQKLVGLVVDYGTTADAPPGQHPPRGVDTYCAQVGAHGTSAQVLVSYASVRSDSGLVCAVDGYPANECGVIVHPTPKPTPTRTSPRPSHGTSAPAATSLHAAGAATSPTTAGASTTTTGPSGTASTSTSGASQDPVPVAVGSGGISDPPSGATTTPAGALAGAGLVLVVGAAALVRARRRRTPPGGDGA